MKVFISSDIEGTCGIAAWDETEPGKNTAGYEHFRRQMTEEVRGACEGALAAGAAEVLVRDAHDTARNIDPSALPREASIIRGWCGDLFCMMSGLDESFSAAMMTGYHSWAGGSGNPLSHTMNGSIYQVILCGELMSEFMLNAMMAGHLGVPVPFLSGDKALCDFAAGWIPGITTVAVSEGFGDGSRSIHPKKAVAMIEEGVSQALSGDYKRCRVPMPSRFDIAVTFRQHKLASSRGLYPGATMTDSRTVSFKTEDFIELLRFCHFVL